MQLPSTLAGGKGLTPSEIGGDVTGGRVLGNSGADSITIAGTVNPHLFMAVLTTTPSPLVQSLVVLLVVDLVLTL